MHRWLVAGGLWLAVLFSFVNVQAEINRFASNPPEIQTFFAADAPRGQGPFYWFIIHVYDAAFWSKGEAKELWGEKEKFALSIVYSKVITNEEFVESTIEEMQNVRPELSNETLLSYQNDLERVYRDVKRGDRITAINLPSLKDKPPVVRFFHNGTKTGDVQLPQFSDTFFAIWLDKKTTATSLRKALLGNDKI